MKFSISNSNIAKNLYFNHMLKRDFLWSHFLHRTFLLWQVVIVAVSFSARRKNSSACSLIAGRGVLRGEQLRLGWMWNLDRWSYSLHDFLSRDTTSRDASDSYLNLSRKYFRRSEVIFGGWLKRKLVPAVMTVLIISQTYLSWTEWEFPQGDFHGADLDIAEF